MQKTSNDIILFLVVTTLVILLMAGFILTILFLYRKRQSTHEKDLETIKSENEKNMLTTQLEIQEQTFHHISREIHDNISLSLTLAKLHLRTLNWDNKEQSIEKINCSIELLGQSIHDLSDISKGLNADVIIQHGLTRALEDELQRIRQIGLFNISSQLTGNPVYMEAQKELIIFRIVQEAFNNIIKHAKASEAQLNLHYDIEKLYISIVDNGNGFDTGVVMGKRSAGLKNMETRIKMLEGDINISSMPGLGTTLSFTIPFDQL